MEDKKINQSIILKSSLKKEDFYLEKQIFYQKPQKSNLLSKKLFKI